MQPNVGERDKLLRTILGIYAMLLGFLFIQGVIGIIVGALGLVSLVTGLVGWCGIYSLLGWSTLEPGPETADAVDDRAVEIEADNLAPDSNDSETQKSEVAGEDAQNLDPLKGDNEG